jgi:UDP-2-acetamido-3-amino-2,3-dideoxy-glucuronate N-acetyltransferase
MTSAACSIALLGHGRWGKNHARVLHELGVLSAICDPSIGSQDGLRERFPGVALVDRVELLDDVALDGVVLATPAATHAVLARRFLERGVHVLVEKPLALELAEGLGLVQLARAKKRVLQVGHILEYHPVRRQIAGLVAEGVLGELLSARLVRTNLGTIRNEEDVLFSFSPHDIAFALELGGGLPAAVNADGLDLLDRGLADSASATLYFERPRFRVQLQASWLEPIKEHRALLVGTKGMLEWVDTKGKQSLTLFRTSLAEGADRCPTVSLDSRESLPLANGEPLKLELLDFIACITQHGEPRSSGKSGADVLAVLDACARSISQQRRVEVSVTATDSFVHETAIVHPSTTLGKGTKIWHHCHVMGNTTIGDNVSLGQNGFVASRVTIGNGTRIQNNVSLYEGVELGEDVFVGPSAVFTNVRFPRAFVSRKDEYEHTKVSRGATIGANSTIVCGVKIGEYAFVAAGAVVTKEVPPHVLVEGVPAVRAGFMCRCGERLHFLGREETNCRRCHQLYRKEGSGIVLVE